jgi:hypothetical protein
MPIFGDKSGVPSLLEARAMLEARGLREVLARHPAPAAAVLCMHPGVLRSFRRRNRSTRLAGFLGDVLLPQKYRGSLAVAGNFGIGAPVVVVVAVPHQRGVVWTTDAPYRETRAEADACRAQGVAAVDMESAGLLAMGQARGVETAAVLVAGDRLLEGGWSMPSDLRGLHQRLADSLDALAQVALAGSGQP